jgi:phage terminase small subunit
MPAVPPRRQSKPTRISTQERMFVEAYCTPGVGPVEAARVAGFKSPDLSACAYNQLRKPKIKEAIEKLMTATTKQYKVTRESIIQRVAEKFWEKDATAGEVARLGKLLAEMTPGALVPVDVHHTGELTLEAFLSAGQVDPNPQTEAPARLQLVGE